MTRLRFVVVLTLLFALGCTPTARVPSVYGEQAFIARGTVYRVVPMPAECTKEDGPPLLFLHGLGDVAATWRHVVVLSRACRRKIIVDEPGLGDSPTIAKSDVTAKAILEGILAIADVESPDVPVLLVGHSLGGNIAVRLAAMAPQRVAAIVIIGAPILPFEMNDEQKLFIDQGELVAPIVRTYGVYAASAEIARRSIASKVDVDPSHAGLLARQLGDSARRRALERYVHELAVPGAVREASLVSCPVWVLAGVHDGFGVNEGRFESAPQVTRDMLPGGHLATIEAPVEVARAVDRAAEAIQAPSSTNVVARTEVRDALHANETSYGWWRELHPIVGGVSLYSRAGWDHGAVLGIARGSIDRHYPLEAGRVVFTLGAMGREERDAFRLQYLRFTARGELVWRWFGGVHIDAIGAIDPESGKPGGVGALGYVPSALPFVRGFGGLGKLPGVAPGPVVGLELDLRFTGLLY